MRFPLKWNDVKENIKQYKTLTKNIGVIYTASNLNEPSKEKTMLWIRLQGFTPFINNIVYPLHFAVDVDEDHELWDYFIHQVNWQDRLKGTNIQESIPEIYEKINP